jgi:hypothetical protein
VAGAIGVDQGELASMLAALREQYPSLVPTKGRRKRYFTGLRTDRPIEEIADKVINS